MNKTGLLFRFLNALSGDRLKSRLTLGVLSHVGNCYEILSSELDDSRKIQHIRRELETIKSGVSAIFEL